MKDETSQPIEPSSGERLEARIVARVMGEASAFEAEELERLCAERPALEAFRKEMEEVHGLLKEDRAETPEWKLPGEKRRAVEALFGDEKEQAVRRSGWRTWWAMAACVAVTAGALWFAGAWRSELPPLMAEKSADFMPATAPAPVQSLERRMKIIRDQEDKVEERRKVLSMIMRTKRIGEAQGARSALGAYNALEQEKMELESQIQNLLKYDSDQLMLYAAALNLPDNTIKKLHPQYLEQKRQLDGLKAQGYGDQHPAVLANKEVLETLKRQLEEGVTDLRESLQSQLELSEMKLAQIDLIRDDRKEDAIKRSLDVQDYIDAKRDFEQDLALLHEMKAGLAKDLAWAGESEPRAALPAESRFEKERMVPGQAAGEGREFAKRENEAIADSMSALAKEAQPPGSDLLARGDVALEPMNPADVDPFVLPEEGEAQPLTRRAAPRSRIAPQEMAVTGEAPVSTFSLNVSDISFLLAMAALEKGQTPDPAGVKVEQFYNAVDYGDPSASAGEKVAATIEQSADPLAPGTNLVRMAIRTGASGRVDAQPLRLTLLVDQSGSMTREDRREALEEAMRKLGELLKPEDRVTVIGFARTPRLLAEGIRGDDAEKLLEAATFPGGGEGTNLEEALRLGEELARRQQKESAQNRVVLITDGAANLGNADPARLAERVAALRRLGIAFDVAGTGVEGLNDRLLGELARNGNGRYLVVGPDFAERLAGAFRPAAEDVKVQVRFNPERVSRYRLVGFEKDRLADEDFRNDAVDAAELAAEESGVALYQVELLPKGTGEIGSVAVRFRDAGSGETVERSWTIAYDPAAPAFDRAPSSMQLAGLAMLAGEKLKGGPSGEAIDFRNFAEPMAKVRQAYAGSRRAGDLLRMIDLLSK